MKFNQFVPWVILLCCVILIIGFFIPSFKFSCAGYGSVGVSALNASFGYSYMGESIVNALVYPLLLLLIPIGVGVICFIRKIGEKIKAIIVAGSFFVELVIYIILAILAASIARELGCDEAVTAMYIINLFFSVVGILAGVFLIFEDKFMGMIDKAVPPNRQHRRQRRRLWLHHRHLQHLHSVARQDIAAVPVTLFLVVLAGLQLHDRRQNPVRGQGHITGRQRKPA